MTELSRNLLAAARDGLSPDAAAMARVRARVAASVAASTGAAAAIPAKAATGLGVKLGIGAVIVATVAVGVVVTRPSAPRVAAPALSIGSADTDESRDIVQVAASEPAPVAAAPVSVAPATRPPVPARPTAPAVVAPAPADEAVSLAREVELIDRAMLLVRRGDAREALTVIATYQRETHGDGQMAEDAAAIDIEARCGLHQDVTARLATFDRLWPTSAQRSRLQDRCFAR